MQVIAKQLDCVEIACNKQPALCDYDLEISWKDWIFEESRRRLDAYPLYCIIKRSVKILTEYQRLCVVYQIVNMLVYFEPAAMCDLQRELTLAPLPAKKQLWEAGDEFVWKAESERGPGAQTSFGLAANGELVQLDKGQLYSSDAVLLCNSLDARPPPRSTANWEEWYSEMDGFGGLVMLAASLKV